MAAVDEQVIDILDLFYNNPNMKSLAEIVNGTGHDRQAVRRRLATLVNKGYLRLHELERGHQWTLTAEALLKLNRASDAKLNALVQTASRLVDQARDMFGKPMPAGRSMVCEIRTTHGTLSSTAADSSHDEDDVIYPPLQTSKTGSPA